jgi:hypothetical protein
MERTGLKENNDETDIFDELMEHIGMEGKFQSRFNLIFNMAFVLTVAVPSYNLILAVTLPNHWCHIPGRNETNYTVAEWKSLTLPRYTTTRLTLGKSSLTSGNDHRMGNSNFGLNG